MAYVEVRWLPATDVHHVRYVTEFLLDGELWAVVLPYSRLRSIVHALLGREECRNFPPKRSWSLKTDEFCVRRATELGDFFAGAVKPGTYELWRGWITNSGVKL